MSKWLMPLLLVLCLGFTGCSADRQAGTENDTAAETTENAAEDTREAAREATETVADVAGNAALTARVKTALATLEGVDATEINVNSEDGVVTLDGVVPSAEAKANALSTAKKTKDVKSVVDKLKVGTPGPNDGVPESGPARNTAPTGN